MASIQDRSTLSEARWRVRWRDGRAAAHTRSHTFSSPPTNRGQSEAQKAAKRLKAYVDLIGHHLEVVDALVGAGFRVAGIPAVVELEPEPDLPPVVTIAECAARWLAGLVRPNPRTREDYRNLLDRHVLPILGDHDIATLRREDVALWLRAQEDSHSGRGGGPALHSIANRHGVLSAMLADAAADGLRAGNPAKGLGPTPKSLHREMCFLTHQEWAIMHRALYRPLTHQSRDDPTLGQDLATLLVGSGVRYGEATALSVEQCDLLAPRAIIRIDRAWKRQPDGSYAIAEPKSRRSVRSIDVPEQVRDVLISRTIEKEPTDLVFVTPRTGGHYLSSWFWDRYWKQALDRAKEAGLRKRPRVHDLRHTHASWLIADGRPLAAIQRRLGHESITTTVDRYSHLMPELEAGNADAIERALAAMRTPESADRLGS